MCNMRKYRVIVLFLLLGSFLSVRAITPEALADSLNRWADLRTRWSSKVKVDRIETKGKTISVHTNRSLSGLSLSEERLAELRKRVAWWVARDTSYTTRIYTENTELAELISGMHKGNPRQYKYLDRTLRTPIRGLTPLDLPGSQNWQNGLYDRYIALWPSHGTYYNRKQELWRWQRATMWTTVEDLYTTEYTRQIARMIENAGGIVLQPRPRLDGRDLMKRGDQWVFEQNGDAYQKGRSGMQRWQEAACEWLKYAGFPDSIYDYFKGENDYKSDMYSRGKWVNFLVGGSDAHPGGEGLGIPVDLCLAMHTDGLSEPDNRSIVGTLAIYYTKGDDKKTTFPNGVSRKVNRDLSDYVQTQIVNDIRTLYCPRWTRRMLNDANYAESRIPEIPCVLIELLSHKNMPDMIYGLNPQFRFDASRAVYKGILRYLHAQAGTSPIVQPLPVWQCSVERLPETDTLSLSWQAHQDPLEPTADPSYYVVYIRENDGKWQSTICDSTNYRHLAQRGTRYDYYVLAGNAGGLSFPSETLSAYLAPKKGKNEPPMLLVINDFNYTGGPEWFNDSTFAGIVPGSYAVEDGLYGAYIGDQIIFDRRLDWTDDDNCGHGMCNRDYQHMMTMGNTHDYPVQHGRILAAMGYSYVSANITSNPTLDECYAAVDIICGKQPYDKQSVIPYSLQRQIQSYLAHYGRVLLSGSYLGSGMHNSSEKKWCERQLHYKYRAPRSCHNGQLEAEQEWLGVKQIELRQHPADTHLFAESPESLEPVNGAVRLGNYADMRIPFGIAWKSYVSKKNPQQARTVVFGFPLECSPQFATLYRASIHYLLETDNPKKKK